MKIFDCLDSVDFKLYSQIKGNSVYMIFFKVNYLFGGSHFYRLLWVLQNLIVLLSRASVSVACLAIIFCGACEEFFMFVINWNQLFF
jgi:hypothetical protein